MLKTWPGVPGWGALQMEIEPVEIGLRGHDAVLLLPLLEAP